MNSKAGGNTVKVTSSNGATLRFAIHEFKSLSTSASLDQVTSATGSTAAPATSGVTTAATNELVFGFAEAADAPTWSAGAGYTLLQSPANKLGTEYKILSSTQTVSASFSINPASIWAAFVATFK